MSRTPLAATSLAAIATVLATAATPARAEIVVGEPFAVYTDTPGAELQHVVRVDATSDQLLFVTTAGCGFVDDALTLPPELFDCKAAAPPGAVATMVVRQSTETFTTRDAMGRVISGGAAMFQGGPQLWGTATNGTHVLLLKNWNSELDGLSHLHARLYLVDGTPLTDWLDTGVFCDGLSAASHDGTGFVIAWTSALHPETPLSDAPSRHAYIASLDISPELGVTVGPVAEIAPTLAAGVTRNEPELDCANGRCFLQYVRLPDDLSPERQTAWASWRRESTPQLVAGEAVSGLYATSLDDAGWRDVRWFILSQEGGTDRRVVRVDATTGAVIDTSDDLDIQYPFTPRRLGAQRSAISWRNVSGDTLFAQRVDFVPGAVGDACSLDADCESGLCGDDDVCTAIVLEPDAGVADASALDTDAGASSDGGIPDAMISFCDTLPVPRPDAAGATATDNGGGCGCAVGARGEHGAPNHLAIAAFLITAISLTIRRRR